MPPILGKLILVLSGMGFPLTQLVIRRFGRPGAVVVEVVCVGLLVRDVALVAGGAPGQLRRGPAILLWLELAAAAVAAAVGARPALRQEATQRAAAARPDAFEAARRGTIGVLFGLHTLRFRIYLQPDQGRRSTSPQAWTGSA